MSIVIFGDLFTFPGGNAATNRVYTYARGLNNNGINAYVVCFQNEYIDEQNGTIDGIDFFHPLGQAKRHKYFIVRRWHKLKKFYNALKILKKIDKKHKIEAVICYSRLLQTQFLGRLLAKSFNAKILLEVSEHPLKDYQGNVIRKLEGKIRAPLEAKFCDGILCISQYLVEFYKKLGVSSEKLFLIPSTVDTERFSNSMPSNLDFDYILYCGDLNLSKDGVDILIKSFAKLAKKFSEINLVLIGKGEKDQEIILKNIVSTLNLESRIHFLGQLPRTQVPSYLMNAKVLALSRPESIVASAGFPSKLTEYLAAGKPVVVTSVGEIPNFLVDGATAFLAEPGNVDSFAEKLNFVLSNYEIAKNVAENGKKLATTIFNYNLQTQKLAQFIKAI